jgi:hypothetical protein
MMPAIDISKKRPRLTCRPKKPSAFNRMERFGPLEKVQKLMADIEDAIAETEMADGNILVWGTEISSYGFYEW